MRRRDLTDYLELRRTTENAWEVIRFRHTQRAGRTLIVRRREAPPLYIRGATHDCHVYHRIFVKDEYQISGHSGWSCVVDLGANVGFFTARSAEIARRVIGYEPLPESFQQLQRNTRQLPQVTAVRAAVAAKAGPLRLYRPQNAEQTGMHSSFRELEDHMSQLFDDVDAVSLDDVFARHEIDHCDLLKLDVEGQEYEILHSASAATIDRIQRIHGEYHDVRPHDPRTRIDDFVRFLRDLGFHTETIPSRKHPNLGLFFARRPEA
ncbi:MAG: FkbM family methyltransferase [Myxococcota bacterium]